MPQAINVEPDLFVVPFKEVKAHKNPESGLYTRLEGIASVFDVLDEQDDIVMRGAFEKTIRERVSKGLVRFMDSHWYDVGHTLGTVREAKETDAGLWFSADLASTPDAQAAAQKAAEGHLKLSIGYNTISDEWEKTEEGRYVRRLREIRLLEISLVPLAANEDTFITLVKAVVPYQDLPLADEDRSWDATAAVGRIRRWAGGPDKDDIDWTKYRRAFVLWDRDEPEQFGSYKLPIADVIDGKLMAVPRGIFAAAAVLMGARGGVDPFDDGDIEGAKRHIARYYKKMDREPPWEREGSSFDPWEMITNLEEVLSTKEGRVLSQANYNRLKEALDLIQNILATAEPSDDKDTHGSRDAGKDGDGSAAPPAKARTELERRARLLENELSLAI